MTRPAVTLFDVRLLFLVLVFLVGEELIRFPLVHWRPRELSHPLSLTV